MKSTEKLAEEIVDEAAYLRTISKMLAVEWDSPVDNAAYNDL